MSHRTPQALLLAATLTALFASQAQAQSLPPIPTPLLVPQAAAADPFAALTPLPAFAAADPGALQPLVLRPQGLLFDSPKDGPSALTLTLTGLGLAAVLSTELFKDHLAPDQPRVTDPNPIDRGIRNALHWDEDRMGAAALTSDLLLFGLFGSSVFWTPALSKLDYATHLEINLETLLFTALLTQTAKFLVGRERPYAAFDSQEPRGVDDNLSFFSGHTSLTFSLATANAVILADSYPDQKLLAYALPLTLAASTAYLRIAADKHYFTDVLVGFLVGSTVGYLVSNWRLDRWGHAEE